LFIQHVFRPHGLCRTLVGDRDPRWTSDFFQQVFSRLGSSLHLSTAAHPQTDGQTERHNLLVEECLRSFVAHHQQDWGQVLPLVEFAMNDKVSSATKQTPFFLTHGRHPLAPADLVNPSSTALNLTTAPAVKQWLDRHQAVIRAAGDCLVAAQARQARYADRGHKAVNFKVGDQVLVHRDFLVPSEARGQPSAKLSPRYFGPYEITQKISTAAFRVKLPDDCRAHPVLNVSALQLYRPNTIPDRVQPPPPPSTDIKGHQRFDVQEVIGERTRKGKLSYRVHWVGFDKSESTWEPASFLKDEFGTDIPVLQRYKEAQRLAKESKSSRKRRS
jgi:hypothetical protein